MASENDRWEESRRDFVNIYTFTPAGLAQREGDREKDLDSDKGKGERRGVGSCPRSRFQTETPYGYFGIYLRSSSWWRRRWRH